MGPTGELTDLRIAENPKIPKTVDEVIDENLNVTNTLKILYGERNFDIYYLIKAFSSGAFGMKEKRLVPTRWSITATDDLTRKKFLLKKLRSMKRYQKLRFFQIPIFLIILKFCSFPETGNSSSLRRGHRKHYGQKE
ncbi:hypothetical protein MSIBF_A2940006 [groundwater metagenome]|uniref:Archaeal Nre N-terminal domain-containing protein n=1 Tax=groundwater metagenome TaxID=717931 RepID=A0A098EAA6_9ZZZZ